MSGAPGRIAARLSLNVMLAASVAAALSRVKRRVAVPPAMTGSSVNSLVRVRVEISRSSSASFGEPGGEHEPVHLEVLAGLEPPKVSNRGGLRLRHPGDFRSGSACWCSVPRGRGRAATGCSRSPSREVGPDKIRRPGDRANPRGAEASPRAPGPRYAPGRSRPSCPRSVPGSVAGSSQAKLRQTKAAGRPSTRPRPSRRGVAATGAPSGSAPVTTRVGR